MARWTRVWVRACGRRCDDGARRWRGTALPAGRGRCPRLRSRSRPPVAHRFPRACGDGGAQRQARHARHGGRGCDRALRGRYRGHHACRRRLDHEFRCAQPCPLARPPLRNRLDGPRHACAHACRAFDLGCRGARRRDGLVRHRARARFCRRARWVPGRRCGELAHRPYDGHSPYGASHSHQLCARPRGARGHGWHLRHALAEPCPRAARRDPAAS